MLSGEICRTKPGDQQSADAAQTSQAQCSDSSCGASAENASIGIGLAGDAEVSPDRLAQKVVSAPSSSALLVDDGATCLSSSAPSFTWFDTLEAKQGDLLRGVSVHCLQTVLLDEVKTAGLTAHATVHEIEPVIRAKGAGTICPHSKLQGASYVDMLSGADNVGTATYMLSYTWGYSIGDIIETLSSYCTKNKLDIKLTYVWICCLCINQHRVKEAQASGEHVSFETFEQEFRSRVTAIKHILALMSTWSQPKNLTRVWCNFELHVATHLESVGCVLEILMPRREESAFCLSLIEGSGLDKVWKTLSRVDIETAQAFSDVDRQHILELIKQQCKHFTTFNRRVTIKMQDWFTSTAERTVRDLDSESCSPERKAFACSAVAKMLQKLGKISQAEELLSMAQADLSQNGLLETYTGACLLTLLGSVKWRTGQADDADACFAEASRVFELSASQNTCGAALLSMEQGTVQIFHKDLAAARMSYEQAYSRLESSASLDSTECGDLHRCLGQLKRSERNQQGAIESFIDARRILELNGTFWTPDGVVLLTNLGNLRRDSGDLEAALVSHAEGYDIADALGILKSLEGAGLLMSMGRVKSMLGDSDGAMKTFVKAHHARKALGSLRNTGGALLVTYMAATEEQRGRKAHARILYEEALQIWQENKAGTHTQALKCIHALERLVDNKDELIND